MKESFFEIDNQIGLTAGEQNPKLVFRNSTPKNMEGGEGELPEINQEKLEEDIRSETKKRKQDGTTQDDAQARAVRESLEQQGKVRKSQENDQIEPETISEIDARVNFIKNRLIDGNLSDAFLLNVGDDEDKLGEYAETLENILELEGEEFIQKYEEFSHKVFGKVVERTLDTVPPDADFASLMGAVDNRDEIFELIFQNMDSLNDADLMQLFRNQGRGLVTFLSADTINARQYTENLNEIINNPNATRRDIVNLLSEIRADAAMVDGDADGSFDQGQNGTGESRQNEQKEEETEAPQTQAGAGGSAGEPPDRPVAGGSDEKFEDPDENSKGQNEQRNDIPEELVERVLRAELGRTGVGQGIIDSYLKDPLRIEELDERRRAIRERIRNTPRETQGNNQTRRDSESESFEEESINVLNGFAGFDVEQFVGTKLEKAAQRMRDLSMEKVTPQGFKDLIDKIEKEEWLDENGHIKSDYDAQLLLQFRNEFEKRYLNEQENQRINAEKTRRRLKVFGQRQESGNTNPRSIQEVAQIIIMAEGEDRWGREGTFPLLDEHENLNEDNFLIWIRERILYHDSQNSRDTNLQLPALIGVDNIYGSTISVFSMEKSRKQYFYDRVSEIVLDKLADQLKTEIWLFGKIRNYDLIYKQYMTQDSKLPEFLLQVHQLEELIQGDSLERILTMSDRFNLNPEKAKDTKVGDATRKAYMLYYNISDFEKLESLLGKDSSFFSKGGFIDAIKIINNKEHDFDIEKSADPVHQGWVRMVNSMFDDKGKLIKAKFINVMNPFNSQGKNEDEIKLSREMTRQAVAELYDLEYGLDKSTRPTINEHGVQKAPERQFLRTNLEYAEKWAWILARFTGAGARNDPDAVGFDAQTKVIKFMRYRVGQSRRRRGGQFGNKYNLGVMKSLTQDFFSGIQVQPKPGSSEAKTPMRVFEEMDTIERDALEAYNLQLKEENGANVQRVNSLAVLPNDMREQLAAQKAQKTNIRFRQNAQIDYASNHLARSFEIFHGTMGSQELRVDEMVKWETHGLTGRWIADVAKMQEEFSEKLIKPLRYAYSTYNMLDFGEKERVETGEVDNEGVPIYKEMVRADKIFGPVVTESLKNELFKGKGSLSSADKEKMWIEYVRGDGRQELWKRALMARISKDLLSHRERIKGNPYAYMGLEQIEAFYKGMESMKGMLAEEIEGATDIKLSHVDEFINPKEEKWMRKHSKTEKWRLYSIDLAPEVGYGLLGGLFAGFRDFVKEGFK